MSLSTTTTTITHVEQNSSAAGPSTQVDTPCSICNAQAAKYTCPRCRAKTCSLPCARSHKSTTGCSGVRDKAAYVPMNQYGYSTMVDDYMLLEDVGRKVGEWGRDIAKRGLLHGDIATGTTTTTRAMSAQAGRGGRGGKGMRSSGRAQDKRRYLAMQLGFRDVHMDVLPQGMERAKRNRSFWDSKKQTALLTLEFILSPPREHGTQEQRKISFLSNKNEWTKTIRDLVRSSLRTMKKDEKLLDWLGLDSELVNDSGSSSVLCVMKRPKIEDDPSDPNYGKATYYKLDFNAKLSSALRDKQFVEYPTIELVDENDFSGFLVEADGFKIDPSERRVKRRKLDAETAKKTISGLVGGYGSDEDEDDKRPNQLSTLESYLESDGEDSRPVLPSEDEGDSGDDMVDVVMQETVGDSVGKESNEEVEIPLILGMSEVPLDIEELPSGDEGDAEWIDEEIAEDEAKLAELATVLDSRQK